MTDALTPPQPSGDRPATRRGGSEQLLHPSHPERYPRRVLLGVAGLSPSIITETLYALAVPLAAGDRTPAAWEPFVPTEIHLITTSKGRDAAIQALLTPEEGAPQGHLKRLFADYPQHFGPDLPAFGPEHIHVIERDGCPVLDIDTPEDSTATGDTIIGVLREFVGDPGCAIHASIAGGRKSMSFLLGMCMSLLGRAQDRVSHVLVPEAFEVRNFYFPPSTPVTMAGRFGPVSTSDARITLATLPLLRIFDGLGVKLGTEGRTFMDAVELGELEIQRPMLRVRPKTRMVELAGRRCQLTLAEMFLYTLLALRRQGLANEDERFNSKLGAVRIHGGTQVGFGGEFFERTRAHVPQHDFQPMTPALMRSRVARINAKLVEAFGGNLAKRSLIVGPSASNRDGRYGLLNVDPGDIHVQ